MVMCAVALAMPVAADAAQDDDIPGVPICASLADVVVDGLDDDDVYRVYLRRHERLEFTMTELNPPGSDIDVLVYRTDSTAIAGGVIVGGSADPCQPGGVRVRGAI